MNSRLDPTAIMALEDLAELAARLDVPRGRALRLPPGEQEAALQALAFLEREVGAELRDLERRRG